MKYLFMFCRREFSSCKVWGISCFLKPHFVAWPTDFVLSVVISVRKTSFPFRCGAVTGLLSVNYHWNYWSVVGTFPVSVQAVLGEEPKSFLMIEVVASVDFCSFNLPHSNLSASNFPCHLIHIHECFLWYLAFFSLWLSFLTPFSSHPHPSFGCFSISLSYFLWFGKVDPGNWLMNSFYLYSVQSFPHIFLTLTHAFCFKGPPVYNV